jgi:hypothetical protein
MASEDRNIPTETKRITGGRDTPGKFHAENMIWGYSQAFLEIKKLGVKPNRIFIGACGFGADVMAAHLTWPEAHITALSLGETPTKEVIDKLVGKLDFQERSLMDYLNQANHDFSLRGFDLAIIVNALTPEISSFDFNNKLGKIVSRNGYFFHQVMAGSTVYTKAFDILWNRIPIPEKLTEQEYFLWQTPN